MDKSCISCNEGILEVAMFCHKCGSQQKCKSCNAPIVKGANNCIGCGIKLSEAATSNVGAVNTIEFKETAMAREYKVAFTNEVGANVVDVVKNMLESQMGKEPLKLGPSQNGNSGGSEEETEDIESEVVDSGVANKTQQSTTNNDNKIPHINDIEKTLECSESDWILVYAFYISDYGDKTFTQAQVYKKYKDQRGTDSRLSNFSNKWKKLFKEHFRTKKDDEIQLTEKGSSYAKGIVTKQIVSKPGQANKKSSSKKDEDKGKKTDGGKKNGKTSAKSIEIEEFDLSKGNKKPSLEDFLEEKKVGENTSHRILTIAYYVIKYCNQDSFSEGNIEYAYKVLKLSNRPLHLYQTILNAKRDHVWYDRVGKRWKVARAGEIHVEQKLPAKN